MNCSDAREKLSALLDGGAPDGLRSELAVHVAGCADCSAELEVFAATDGVVHRGLLVAEAAAPDGYFKKLWPQVNKRLEEEPQERDAMSMSRSQSGKRGPGTPGKGAGSDTGLHDIRDLARTTLERRAQTQPEDVDEDLLGSASPVSLGQVVLPKRAREGTSAGGARRSIVPLLIGGVLVASLGAAAAVLVLKTMATNSAPVAVAGGPSVTVSDPSADMIGGSPGASDPAHDVQAKAAPEDEDDGSGDEDKAATTGKPEKRANVTSGKRPPVAARKGPKGGDGVAPEGPIAKPDDKPARPKPAKGGGGKKDEIDNLLDVAAFGGSRKDDSGSSGGGGGGRGSDLPEKLSRTQVTSTLRGLNSRVQTCYHRLKEKGTVQIKIKINATGHVGSAKAGGKFAGTPTGECVSDVVRGAKFPQFNGPSMTLTYPFLLI